MSQYDVVQFSPLAYFENTWWYRISNFLRISVRRSNREIDHFKRYISATRLCMKCGIEASSGAIKWLALYDHLPHTLHITVYHLTGPNARHYFRQSFLPQNLIFSEDSLFDDSLYMTELEERMNTTIVEMQVFTQSPP